MVTWATQHPGEAKERHRQMVHALGLAFSLVTFAHRLRNTSIHVPMVDRNTPSDWGRQKEGEKETTWLAPAHVDTAATSFVISKPLLSIKNDTCSLIQISFCSSLASLFQFFISFHQAHTQRTLLPVTIICLDFFRQLFWYLQFGVCLSWIQEIRMDRRHHATVYRETILLNGIWPLFSIPQRRSIVSHSLHSFGAEVSRWRLTSLCSFSGSSNLCAHWRMWARWALRCIVARKSFRKKYCIILCGDEWKKYLESEISLSFSQHVSNGSLIVAITRTCDRGNE